MLRASCILRLPVMHEYCIIGPGSIGGLTAYFLRSSNPILIARSRKHASLLRARGLRIIAGGVENLIRPQAYAWRDLEEGRLECRTILLAVKAYQVRGALHLASRLLGEPELAVSLQNGIGPLEMVEEKYGVDRAAAGIVEYGAHRLDPATIMLGGQGRIILGRRSAPPTPRLRRLAEELEEGGGNIMLVDDVEPYRMLKALANSVVNPLTALLDAPNRILVEDPRVRRLARELTAELGMVAGSLVKLPGDPWKYVLSIVEATGSNYSSMLVDLRSGRRTEIDYLNGWFYREACRRGIPTPINNTILSLLKGREAWLRRSRRGGLGGLRGSAS